MDDLVSPVFKGEKLKELLCPLPCNLPWDLEIVCINKEVFKDCEIRVKVVHLGDNAYSILYPPYGFRILLPKDLNFTLCRNYKAKEYPDGGGLSCTVWSKKAKAGALYKLYVNAP